MNETSVKLVEGVLRRQWCQAPDGRSPLEILRNYESAILSKGGQILFYTTKPKSVEIEGKKLSGYFGQHRVD